VADSGNHTIRKITPAGVVTTLAGSPGQPGSADGVGSAARFNFPSGVAVDNAGYIYVADEQNCAIRRITPSGVVTTIAGRPGQIGGADGVGSTAQFSYPDGVAVDGAGNLYVADSWNGRITKGTPLLQFDTAVCVSASGGYFHARLIGPSGNNVAIEASPDFLAWTRVQTNALSPGGLDVSIPLGTEPYRFFRARQAP
jgi:sugar lactone lactonase YvrE